MVPSLTVGDSRYRRTLWTFVKLLRFDALRRYELAYPCPSGLRWSQMVSQSTGGPPGRWRKFIPTPLSSLRLRDRDGSALD